MKIFINRKAQKANKPSAGSHSLFSRPTAYYYDSFFILNRINFFNKTLRRSLFYFHIIIQNICEASLKENKKNIPWIQFQGMYKIDVSIDLESISLEFFDSLKLKSEDSQKNNSFVNRFFFF